jgi:membrane protein YqaA with SNARE-associated domain
VGWIKRLYHWVLSWAESPYAVWALFLIAVAESSFFPVPPDVLLIALALARPLSSFRYSAICTLGSVVGATGGYIIGYAFWQAVGTYFFRYVPGFTPEMFAHVCRAYEANSYFIVFTAAFTPIPYKVITITAGVSQISFVPFLLVSIMGRGLRFFLVGGLIRLFGAPVKVFIEKYFNLLTILFVVIYILAFYFIPRLLQ